ncbi:hypothetical protein [Streptodolium elevatio]|uniref:Uncharacterized protein n=1 Tax=Streptodolium elevatio TaxID=3157996 RepID=A0ABV3DUT4_9ACTN
MHGTTDDADPDQETGLTPHGEIRHDPPSQSESPDAAGEAAAPARATPAPTHRWPWLPRFARDVAVETIGALLALAVVALVVALVALL